MMPKGCPVVRRTLMTACGRAVVPWVVCWCAGRCAGARKGLGMRGVVVAGVAVAVVVLKRGDGKAGMWAVVYIEMPGGVLPSTCTALRSDCASSREVCMLQRWRLSASDE